MKLLSKEISVSTKKELEIVNLSPGVQKAVEKSGFESGLVSLFVAHSTCALTTIEFEPGLLEDFPKALERIVPSNIPYKHDLAWRDGNGHSHVRAALLKPDLVVPFKEKRLLTGTWQQIVLVELDRNVPRNRKVQLTIIGEA